MISKLTNSKYSSKDCGSITINAEEVGSNKSSVVFGKPNFFILFFFFFFLFIFLFFLFFFIKGIYGQHLDKKDFFGKSDPFLRISKAREDNTFVSVHQTEVIKSTLDPRWNQFKLPMSTLNSGDLDRVILFEVFDW
jgi:hypothetical protein